MVRRRRPRPPGRRAAVEDFALDGITPHVVTGTVGVCDTSEPCEALSTRAVALGLCVVDGPPIVVVVTRDCTGAVIQAGRIKWAFTPLCPFHLV